MTFAKQNAAEEGFNRWTINGVAYPMADRHRAGVISSASKASGTGCACAMRVTTFIRSIFTGTASNSQMWRAATAGSDEGCGDGGRISGSGSGFRCRQSRTYVISLSSAIAHGFWIHDPVRLCVTGGNDGLPDAASLNRNRRPLDRKHNIALQAQGPDRRGSAISAPPLTSQTSIGEASAPPVGFGWPAPSPQSTTAPNLRLLRLEVPSHSASPMPHHRRQFVT